MAQVFKTKLRAVYKRRIDPRFHLPEFVLNRKNIRSRTHDSILHLCDLSDETWDGVSFFNETFPYIEISAIDCQDGNVKELIDCPIEDAPSRAKMVVRANDILVSSTRPTRNAITRVPGSVPLAIASTGFFVIRNVYCNLVLRDYLFHALRFEATSKQFDQFSSGGNYPAINKEDIQRVIIPLPPLPREFEQVNRIVNFHWERAIGVANLESLLSYWSVGRFLSSRLKAATWGSKTIEELSDYLQRRNAKLRGYGKRQLYNMVEFYEAYTSDAFAEVFRRLKLDEFVQLPTAQIDV